MTTTKRKPKHALSPLPWRVEVMDPGFFLNGRDKCGIFDADDKIVADYLYREDADAIVAAMNEKHATGATP